MKNKFHSLKLKQRASIIFFYLGIGLVIGATIYMIYDLISTANQIEDLTSATKNATSSGGETPTVTSPASLKYFTVLSFSISTIVMITAFFFRINEVKTDIGHTYYEDENGSKKSLILHNRGEQDLSIVGIYLDQRKIHNSVRRMVYVESNQSVEILLKPEHHNSLKPSSALIISTTLEDITSTFFETPARFGKKEEIAKVYDKEDYQKEENEKQVA